MRRLAMPAAQLVVALALVGLWEWLGATGHIDPGFVGTPLRIASRLAEWVRDGSVLHHIFSTLAVMMSGFLVATVIGTAIGVLIGLSDTTSEILAPFLAFFNGMPRLVLQPLIVVVLGFGVAAKVSLVVVVIVVMVILSIAAAFRDIDEVVVLNARLLGASRSDLARHVYIPAVAQIVISSARNVLGFALQATLVAEFVGTADGLGYLIVKGQQTFDVSTIWASLIVVVILAVILDLLFAVLERQASHWKPET